MFDAAWEITKSDVLDVLRSHGIIAESPVVPQAQAVAESQASAILASLAPYCDLEDQFQGLEGAFRRAGLVGSEVRFPKPAL